MKDVIGGASYEQINGMFEGFDWYQSKCAATAIYPEGAALEYLTMGLASEAGEVTGKVKKKIRDGEPADFKDQLASELGDVFWYLAMLTDEVGLNLSDIAFNNLNKLYKRQIKNTLRGSGDNR